MLTMLRKLQHAAWRTSNNERFDGTPSRKPNDRTFRHAQIAVVVASAHVCLVWCACKIEVQKHCLSVGPMCVTQKT